MTNDVLKHKLCGSLTKSNGSKYLLSLLIDLADEKGAFIMSSNKLSKITGYSPHTILRNMYLLEQTKVIKIVHRYNEDGGRASNKYVLNLQEIKL